MNQEQTANNLAAEQPAEAQDKLPTSIEDIHPALDRVMEAEGRIAAERILAEQKTWEAIKAQIQTPTAETEPSTQSSPTPASESPAPPTEETKPPAETSPENNADSASSTVTAVSVGQTVAIIEAPARPPWPKKSGNQCCLCVNYQGNDPRGPLWSGFGLCKIAPIQYKVTPELVCEKFQFNEALRGA